MKILKMPKSYPLSLALSLLMIFFAGCSTQRFTLGEIPDAKNYRFINYHKKSSIKQAGEGQSTAQIDNKFNPSLLKTLDYELGSILSEGEDEHSVDVYRLRITWENPHAVRDGFIAGLGFMVAGAAGTYAAGVAAAVGPRDDSLLCYFVGEYHGQRIEVRETTPCPKGQKYCFGSSPNSTFDGSLEITKDAVQKNARQCLSDIKSVIARIKTSQAKNALVE